MRTTRSEDVGTLPVRALRGARGAVLLAAILVLVPAVCPADAARVPCDDGWALAVPEPTPGDPTTLGGISGIVELARGRWLTVHDAKRPLDEPGKPPGTRLHLVERSPGG